mmetsp:Transcript_2162/g.2482  ORF Transcript_2162/g.2482 Transcript_2162/m.2482 type:complete len:128 (+) Transcript_2162:134-517(+)|eukprot:CAMPEP_0184015678 /NCGR_PEP_ID=MMETSP0954-20121128/6462_1 /TAXON_ID=627963 /ORGANISM="Aplanochytrium sp, Strain PBS07" /LENGTH=127 /DNA_ID=CAMNT_0026296525 /DNA_START=68 /DNA_END=451 /DNA_ORIENTATION=-
MVGRPLLFDSRALSLLLVATLLGIIGCASFIAGENAAGAFFTVLASIPFGFLIFKALGICCVTNEFEETNQPSSTSVGFAVQASYVQEENAGVSYVEEEDEGNVLAIPLEREPSGDLPVADVVTDSV